MNDKTSTNQLIKTIITSDKFVLYAITLSMVWTIAILLLTAWNIYHNKQTTISLATIEARSNFNKDQAFRFWATNHGGAYVPTDERTQPNPHLQHIPERDIITPSGKKLTLMNPAYMLRQMMEEYNELYGVKSRITSLKPFRAQNAPDEWEKSALKSFENGIKEAFAFIDINGEPYLRLMQPMITKKGCLKCHGYQGYKVGDVRGGVGVSVPLLPYKILERSEIRQLAISHSLIWLMGIFGICFTFLKLRNNFTESIKVQKELQISDERLGLAMAGANIGLWDWNVQSGKTVLNPIFTTFLLVI